MQRISSFKDLLVWQKSIKLTTVIYSLTRNFPQEELFGLTSQMKRAAVSVASNIAEGSIRGSKKDFCHFIRISLGSVAELKTPIEIAKSLPFGKSLDYNEAGELLEEISKMLSGLIRSLKSNT